jgi:hypothetical protein
MSTENVPTRIADHVAAFNAAVGSSDWTTFSRSFVEDATMSFTGVPVGPFAGRAAIAQAYRDQPPTETLAVDAVESADPTDTVSFTWASGARGSMRLTWQDGLIVDLAVTFDTTSGPTNR